MSDPSIDEGPPPLEEGGTGPPLIYFVFDTISNNLIPETAGPLPTDYNAYVRPRSLRNFYSPRFSLFDIFQLYYSTSNYPDEDAELHAVQNNSFFNDPYIKPIITQVQINEVLARTPQYPNASCRTADASCPDASCNICYFPYDADSIIRHHANCCGKYTCEDCFRRMLKDKLECPYCMKNL